jgi:hypothetical protein
VLSSFTSFSSPWNRLINGIKSATKPDTPINIPAIINDDLYPYFSAIQPISNQNYEKISEM